MDLSNLNKDRKNRKKTSNDLSQMMYGKVPPQETRAESAILGAILMEGANAFNKISDLLYPESFYVEANQRVFKAIKALISKGQPTDMITVVSALKQTEELDLVGGPFYISKLMDGVVSSASIISHARRVNEMFVKRELIRKAGEIMSEAYSDSTDAYELLSESEKSILEIGMMNRKEGMIPMSTVLVEAMTQIGKWMANDGTLTGIPSGFPEIDEVTRGFQPGDYIVIGALTSVGKTVLALNIIRNAALDPRSKAWVGVWSLEMKAIFLAIRLISQESEIWMHKIQTGRLSAEDIEKIHKVALNKLKDARIHFDENMKVTMSSLESNARRLHAKGQLNMILVDYLQLLQSDSKNSNREREVAESSQRCHSLAKELNVPLIALSQLKVECEQRVGWDSPPRVSDLRESSQIGNDADLVIFLYGASAEEIKKDPSLDGRRKVRIAKHRNGLLKTMEIGFKNEIQKFHTIDKIVREIKEPGTTSGQWKPVDDKKLF